MMKRTAIFSILLLLVLASCTAVAGASSTCNVKINSFVIHPTTGVAPAKIGLTTYMSGTVTSVSYQILDKNGKVVATCRSFCTHCTQSHICTCSLTIPNPGTYSAKVTAYGTGGCSVSQIKKSAITITAAKLVPTFTYKTSGKKVTFTDKSTGGAVKWTWSFGDGSTSTSKTITHTYKKAGTYKVCLKVCNSAGTCSSVCKSVIVK
jgi:PKD repeat protein